MRDAGLIRRLEKALQEWGERGFLVDQGAKDIIAFETGRESRRFW